MTGGGSFGEDEFSDPVVSPRVSGFLSSPEFTLFFLYDNDFIISVGRSERTSERKQERWAVWFA